MDSIDLRKIVTKALLTELAGTPGLRILPIGNSVHVYVGDDEFELVIKTTRPERGLRYTSPFNNR